MALSKFFERAKYGTLKASSRANRGPLSSGQRSEQRPFLPNAADKAALTAEFGKAYDNVRLLAPMQQKLVDHFAGGVSD